MCHYTELADAAEQPSATARQGGNVSRGNSQERQLINAQLFL